MISFQLELNCEIHTRSTTSTFQYKQAPSPHSQSGMSSTTELPAMQTVWASAPWQQAGILQTQLCQTALLAEVTQLLCSRSLQGLQAQSHQLVWRHCGFPQPKTPEASLPTSSTFWSQLHTCGSQTRGPQLGSILCLCHAVI